MSEIRTESDDFYEDTDVLLRCTSQREADNYIDTVLRIATTKEKEGIAKAFFQLSRAVLKEVRLRGGSKGDKHVYDMLAVADTYHDFGTGAAIDIPFLPKEIQLTDIHNERQFVCKLSSLKHITFEERISNPLFGANILRKFDITCKSLDDAFTKQQSFVNGILGNMHGNLVLPIDIWTEVDYKTNDTVRRRTQVIKLHQVAQLIGTMRRLFGKDLGVIIDSAGNSLTTMVVSLKYINNSLFRRFTTVPYAESVSDLSEKLKSLIDEQEHTEWNPAISDANLFDAADNAIPLPIDDRPTGDVYASHLPYQVSLKGITTAGGRRAHLEIKDRNAHYEFSVTNKETTSHFSTNYLKKIIDETLHENDSKLKDIVSKLSKDTLYALKRAGDWGQVEHCAKYNKMFVTSDKMAAMYAWFRKVRTVFVSYEENLNGEMEGLPDFYRYTFALCMKI